MKQNNKEYIDIVRLYLLIFNLKTNLAKGEVDYRTGNVITHERYIPTNKEIESIVKEYGIDTCLLYKYSDFGIDEDTYIDALENLIDTELDYTISIDRNPINICINISKNDYNGNKLSRYNQYRLTYNINITNILEQVSRSRKDLFFHIGIGANSLYINSLCKNSLFIHKNIDNISKQIKEEELYIDKLINKLNDRLDINSDKAIILVEEIAKDKRYPLNYRNTTSRIINEYITKENFEVAIDNMLKKDKEDSNNKYKEMVTTGMRNIPKFVFSLDDI